MEEVKFLKIIEGVNKMIMLFNYKKDEAFMFDFYQYLVKMPEIFNFNEFIEK